MPGRDQLESFVRAVSSEAEPWQEAELHLLEQALRHYLDEAGVGVTPDVAVALMVASTFLAVHTPEGGGDARATLGEIAILGLRLLEGCEEAAGG